MHIDQCEAEVLMTVLLEAADRPAVSAAVADRLLQLVADAQRELDRSSQNEVSVGVSAVRRRARRVRRRHPVSARPGAAAV
jgi:hypothetical protein